MKKQIVQKLVKSLREEPNDWVFTDFKATNIKSGASIWIANGTWAIHLWQPLEVRFGYFERRKIRDALNYCKYTRLLEVI